jgi:hypothetical protein
VVMLFLNNLHTITPPFTYGTFENIHIKYHMNQSRPSL